MMKVKMKGREGTYHDTSTLLRPDELLVVRDGLGLGSDIGLPGALDIVLPYGLHGRRGLPIGWVRGIVGSAAHICDERVRDSLIC